MKSQNKPEAPTEGEPLQSNPAPLWRSFRRAQVSSLAATVVDYGVFFGCVEILHVWYAVSTPIGAAAGAVTNFLLNRHWSFEIGHKPAHDQAARYALVSTGSLLLNTVCVYALTEYLGLKYGFSKVFSSLAVGLFFNFPLHRRYVFK